MYVRFNDAKPVSCIIRDVQLITKSGTIADGQKYLNWSKKISSKQIKETVGVLELKPGTKYFQDLYSYIFRRVTKVKGNGGVRTEVERLARDGRSTLTIMEDGIRSIKYVKGVDGNVKKTILYDKKGLKLKEIEV